MDVLRLYLLAGLAGHKLAWEVLKRGPAPRRPPHSLRIRVVKAVKIAILAGILVQTVLPDVLPLSSETRLFRVAGTVIYTVGLLTALAARFQLGRNWSDIETAELSSGHALVTNGIYAYIRHPIYTGDLLLVAGLELALNSWLVLGAVLLAPFVFRQAVREEATLRASLPGYAEYCARTRRFLPFVV